jgi:uncharacterized alpha-E superfamily protein
MMLSRVADALYWIGRYLERAEHGARLLDITLTAALEGGREQADASAERAMRALGSAPLVARAGSIEEARTLTFSRADTNSIFSSIALARENARQVREHLTTEFWERLNKLYLRMRESGDDAHWASDTTGFYHEAVGDLHALKGIIEGTMSQGEGVRFLLLGRFLERAQLVSRLLDIHLEDRGKAIDDFGWATFLRMCCGLEPFLRAKTADFRREQVADFLILDEEFPRSLRYCGRRIEEHVSALARNAPQIARATCDRLGGRLRARLDYATLDEVMGRGGRAFLAAVADDCIQINAAVHDGFIAYALEARLPA